MSSKTPLILLAAVFTISLCGLGYELIAGTITSYFLGNSVLQFSLTIGVFLFAMGIGSSLSARVEGNLTGVFIVAEVAISLLGGFFSLIMFSLYACASESFYACFLILLLVIGGLIGLEIPLLIRMVKEYGTLKIALAQVLSLDYLGALVASILFPILILPHLGLMQASFFYGLLNMMVAFLFLSIYRDELRGMKGLTAAMVLISALLLGGFFYSFRLTSFFETRMYADEIILTRQTKYQRIVMTRRDDDVRLYLDGNLQFCSIDEYRYHEVLVHPAMSLAPRREKILILGGGDGLAAREIFKYPEVKEVDLVDLDSVMVELSRTNAIIKNLNGNSLNDGRMKVIIQDAFKYVEAHAGFYDVIFIDLPDPNNESLSKLYTRQFYSMVARSLSQGGIISLQATSPFFARNTFWCIYHTVQAADLHTVPLHANVPSFGEWGFVLASHVKLHPERIGMGKIPTRYLNETELKSIMAVPEDIKEVPTDINTLDNPALLKYYEEDWKVWE